MMGSVRQLDNEEEWIKDLMDLAVSKLCIPLRVNFTTLKYVKLCAHRFLVESSANDPITGE